MEFDLNRITELLMTKSTEAFSLTPPTVAEFTSEMQFKFTIAFIGVCLGYLAGRSLGSMLFGLTGYLCSSVMLVVNVNLRLMRGVLGPTVVVMLALLPFAGMQIASDMNRGLDRSEAVVFERSIQEKVVYDRFLGSPGYLLMFGAPQSIGVIQLPPSYRVSPSVYQAVESGSTVLVEVRSGALGIPWYSRTIPK